MSYSVNYTGLIKHKTRVKSKFGGSSKFNVVDGELIDKNEEKKVRQKQLNLNFQSEKIISEKSERNTGEQKNKSQEKKTYPLNKSKIKKKCHAFGRLEKSKKFFAFYSISFPQNLSDEVCYKIFNTWLTRCRKNSGLKSYLWVAERQKNGTIHFHLLTNDYMKIQVVNGFMASALKTEKKKGNGVLQNIETEKYNGVDVKRVGKNKKTLINYLAKYISKNDIKFYRLPWHCSRDVSRLFTSYNMDENEEDKYFDLLPKELEKYTPVFQEKYFNATGFKFNPNDLVFEDLDGLNELIYSL